ncbi:MAG: phosphoglucosamine mutase [Alphaproteobacteria bacterium]|nr:phosphoglucosamine mutase [Alphaproteobacteria bacterium]|tara:strand:+ start:8339 stop:9685 length:1347 start_codon:yes stop_codon:yes gene_type:complete
MPPKYFGTDGIRGAANEWPMTADVALAVGMAAGSQFIRGDHRHRVVIGKDTRLSGYMIEPALTAGFVAVGMDVTLVGPMPTPAVAMLTRSLRADLGVVISASHNQYQDNGIKLFGPDGYKLSDDVESEIEARLAAGGEIDLARSANLGRANRLDDVEGRYIEFAKNTFPKDRTLDGVKVVVDCANGAAYSVAPTVLWELGATVIPVGVTPDGTNINDGCGSTLPAAMCSQVVAHGADLGLALDGDADRVVLADESGDLLDGDQLMALVATHWQQAEQLASDTIVATVMSNLGLEKYLAGQGLKLERTSVGDRYVVEYMREHRHNVGGEQSGHIILSDFNTTGDGLIAALQALAVFVETGKPVSETGRLFTPFPQVLRNVTVNGGQPLEDAMVRQVVDEGRTRLGSAGRVVVRASGTEPLIRVMAEGEDDKLVDEIVEDIVSAVAQASN